MKYAELFAGAGGMSIGLEAGGFHALAHAEIEPHARAVLRHRWPDTRLDGDVMKINGTDYAGATLISGGSPCQDLSVAGKRAGLTGSRSSLFHEQCRIWRESNAPYLLWENVAGAFSSNNGLDFAEVLSTIVGRDLVATGAIRPDRNGKIKWLRAGRAEGPGAVAAWRVLDLQHFGPPQRRVRVFVLAARAGGVDPAEVLALSEGVCGHPSPRQRSREGVAARARGGAESGVAFGINNDSRAEVVAEGTASLRAGQRTQPAVLAFHHTQDPISGDVSPAIGRPTDGMGVVAFSLMPQNSGKDYTGREVEVLQPLHTGGTNAASNQGGDVIICATVGVVYPLQSDSFSRSGTGAGDAVLSLDGSDTVGSLLARADSSPCVDRGRPAVIAWDNELNASAEAHGPSMARGKSGGGRNGVLAFHHTQDPISGDVSPAIGRPTDGMGVLSFAENDRAELRMSDVTQSLTLRDQEQQASNLPWLS